MSIKITIYVYFRQIILLSFFLQLPLIYQYARKNILKIYDGTRYAFIVRAAYSLFNVYYHHLWLMDLQPKTLFDKVN